DRDACLPRFRRYGEGWTRAAYGDAVESADTADDRVADARGTCAQFDELLPSIKPTRAVSIREAARRVFVREVCGRRSGVAAVVAAQTADVQAEQQQCGPRANAPT